MATGSRTKRRAPSRAGDTLLEALGRQLRAERTRQGLSLHQAAARTGLDFRRLQQLETGRANPTVRTLQCVTAGYEVSVGSVLVSAEATLTPARTPAPKSAGALRVAETPAKDPPAKSNTGVSADIATRFATNVAATRVRLQMSVRTLAERAGISIWYVRRIEAAAQVPTLRVAEPIAVALGVPLASLHSLARPYAAR